MHKSADFLLGEMAWYGKRKSTSVDVLDLISRIFNSGVWGIRPHFEAFMTSYTNL